MSADSDRDASEAWQLFETAEAAYSRQDLQTAERLLVQAAGLTESDVIWANLGLVQGSLEKYEEAVDSYSRADTLTAEMLLNRGLCLERLDRIEDARTDYLAALELNPDDADVLVNLGTLELAEGKTPRALELLERAAQLDPLANWQLSDVFIEMDDLDKSAEVLQIAIQAGENRAHLDLARVEDDRGNRERALELYRQAVAEDISGAETDLEEFLNEADDGDSESCQPG